MSLAAPAYALSSGAIATGSAEASSVLGRDFCVLAAWSMPLFGCTEYAAPDVTFAVYNSEGTISMVQVDATAAPSSTVDVFATSSTAQPVVQDGAQINGVPRILNGRALYRAAELSENRS